MANPFAITPANPLAALMTGVQGYDAGQKRHEQEQLKQLGVGLASGEIDYKQAAGLAAGAGKIDVLLSLLKMGQEQEASKNFAGVIASMSGGQPSAPVSSTPQAMPSRIPTSVAPPTATAPQRPVQQATEGIISAIDNGVDIAPRINSGVRPALAAPAPEPPPSPSGKTQAQAPSGYPMPSQNPASQHIPRLLQAMADPRLPQASRDAAKALLEHALKSTDLAPDMKRYALYRQQGGTDDETTWSRKNSAASSTLINTAEGADAIITKGNLATDLKAREDVDKAATAARRSLPVIREMMRISDKTPEGWQGAVAPTIAKVLSGFGFAVPEGMSNAEAFASMARQVVPSIRDPGATSNFEQQMYIAAVPNASQSADGRQKIAKMMEKQIQRTTEYAAIYRRYAGRPELDAQLQELDNKPLFDKADREFLAKHGGGAETGGGGTAPARLRFNPATGDLQ